MEKQSLWSRFMRGFMRQIFKFYLMIVYNPKIIGKENIPKEGPVILCPNHVHPLDSCLIVAFTHRKVNCLARHELFSKGITKWFAKVVGIYPIKRESADMHAIKLSLQILKNKELLMIFPEGTRNGLAKGVKPKSGAIKIASKANVPIIPVGIGGKFKAFHRVKINIGKPIYYNEYKEQIKNDKETLKMLTENLMNEIVRLRDEY